VAGELSYSTYLRIDDLLNLQIPQSAVIGDEEHDELLFIVIHQVYELWFKQVLHELDHVVDLLDVDQGIRAGHSLKRVLAILKVLVAQMDVLETMTPLEFMSFRERLESGSGFQSVQFRELEFSLGAKNAKVLDQTGLSESERGRLSGRLDSPSLWTVVCRFMRRRGHAVPDEALVSTTDGHPRESPALQESLISAYRTDPELMGLLERLVDLDEGLQEWRYRHVKMVERTIGGRPGTGGSTGAEYLRSTLGQSVFPDLWAIRSRF